MSLENVSDAHFRELEGEENYNKGEQEKEEDFNAVEKDFKDELGTLENSLADSVRSLTPTAIAKILKSDHYKKTWDELELDHSRVTLVQAGLTYLGYGDEVGSIDGRYGGRDGKTRAAVEKFQKQVNEDLPDNEKIVEDGWAGPETLAKLREGLDKLSEENKDDDSSVQQQRNLLEGSDVDNQGDDDIEKKTTKESVGVATGPGVSILQSYLQTPDLLGDAFGVQIDWALLENISNDQLPGNRRIYNSEGAYDDMVHGVGSDLAETPGIYSIRGRVKIDDGTVVAPDLEETDEGHRLGEDGTDQEVVRLEITDGVLQIKEEYFDKLEYLQQQKRKLLKTQEEIVLGENFDSSNPAIIKTKQRLQELHEAMPQDSSVEMALDALKSFQEECKALEKAEELLAAKYNAQQISDVQPKLERFKLRFSRVPAPLDNELATVVERLKQYGDMNDRVCKLLIDVDGPEDNKLKKEQIEAFKKNELEGYKYLQTVVDKKIADGYPKGVPKGDDGESMLEPILSWELIQRDIRIISRSLEKGGNTIEVAGKIFSLLRPEPNGEDVFKGPDGYEHIRYIKGSAMEDYLGGTKLFEGYEAAKKFIEANIPGKNLKSKLQTFAELLGFEKSGYRTSDAERDINSIQSFFWLSYPHSGFACGFKPSGSDAGLNMGYLDLAQPLVSFKKSQ